MLKFNSVFIEDDKKSNSPKVGKVKKHKLIEKPEQKNKKKKKKQQKVVAEPESEESDDPMEVTDDEAEEEDCKKMSYKFVSVAKFYFQCPVMQQLWKRCLATTASSHFGAEFQTQL